MWLWCYFKKVSNITIHCNNYVLHARNNCLKASHSPTISCRRFGFRRFSLSPLWPCLLSPFRHVAVLTFAVLVCCRFDCEPLSRSYIGGPIGKLHQSKLNIWTLCLTTYFRLPPPSPSETPAPIPPRWTCHTYNHCGTVPIFISVSLSMPLIDEWRLT